MKKANTTNITPKRRHKEIEISYEEGDELNFVKNSLNLKER